MRGKFSDYVFWWIALGVLVEVAFAVKPKRPEHINGPLAHPSDYDQFPHSVDGATHIVDCPPGTVFDPREGTCDTTHDVLSNAGYSELSSPAIKFICNMSSSKVATVIKEEYGITDVRNERLIYVWTIKHFKFLPQRSGEYIESPIFRTENEDVEWRLRLYPRGISNNADSHVSLFLMLKSHKADQIKVRVNAQLALLKANHIKINYIFDHTYDQLEGWGDENFILRSSTILDDTFTIRAEIDMPFRIITEPLKSTHPVEQ